MYVKNQTDTQLVLAGVPGRRVWMIVLCVFGLAFTAAAVALIVVNYRESKGGWSWAYLPLALGVLIGQALFWTGAVTLAVGRLSLVLDSAEGKGEYQVRSPIIEAGKPCRFDLEHVDSVAIEATSEWRPGHNDGPETTARVLRAKLRITKPRRSIVLDETENGRLERVEQVATTVADFLELPLLREE